MKLRFKHRVSKEDLKEDRFQETVERVAEWYYRDPKKFWIGAAAVVVMIVGVILLLQNRPKTVSVEAELRLTDALVSLAQGDMQRAEQGFSELTTLFGRDYAGIKAHYYLGHIYYMAQPPRHEEAKRAFAKFLSKAKDDPVLSPAAQVGIGNCEEQLGNSLKAAAAYEAAYRKWPKSALAFDAMMAAGRAYRNAGALAKAEKVYQELLDRKEKPTGQQMEEIRMQLAHVQALKNRL
uniref:Tetratricopeptide repeat protein n=1 Tax=candidate division WOR-3 bacterium TaxID=2052148 RepID=A0A7C4GB28_UNCW3